MSNIEETLQEVQSVLGGALFTKGKWLFITA